MNGYTATINQDQILVTPSGNLDVIDTEGFHIGDEVYLIWNHQYIAAAVSKISTVPFPNAATFPNTLTQGQDTISAQAEIIFNPELGNMSSTIIIKTGLLSYAAITSPTETGLIKMTTRLIDQINADPNALVNAALNPSGSLQLTAKNPGTGGNSISLAVEVTIQSLGLHTDLRYNGTLIPANAEISLQTFTRELITYKVRDQVSNFFNRSLFRYPYLPASWSGISHSGPLTPHERVDVKTFGNNITVDWETVLQDTVIIEEFDAMDYKFFHILWQLYMSRNHLLYRPRDLNYNEYEIELIEIHAGKQDRFWVHSVSLKYKIHSITTNMTSLANRYEFVDKKIFPKAPGSPS
jgi:hypothetical protein